MAKAILLCFILLAIFSNIFISGECSLLDKLRRAITKEKSAVLHFYVQDVLGGPSPTGYEVARATITAESPTSFGLVRVIDNLMTAGPQNNSKPLGRVQGVITSADLRTPALFMSLTFVFTAGADNGSTITVLGRNGYTNPVRELAVVGGTGLYRFATGYAVLKSYSHDQVTGSGVLDYTVYVTYVQRDFKYYG